MSFNKSSLVGDTEKIQQCPSFPLADGSTGLWHLADLHEAQVQLHALPNLEERLELESSSMLGAWP